MNGLKGPTYANLLVLASVTMYYFIFEVVFLEEVGLGEFLTVLLISALTGT